MSNLPKALQRLADAAMYGNTYRDSGPLWAYLQRSHRELADKIARQPPRGNNPDKLVQSLRDAMKTMRQAKKRGNWKPSRDFDEKTGETRAPPPKAAALPPRKARPANPDLAKGIIVGAEEMLWDTDAAGDSTAATQIDPNDITSTSSGFAVVAPGDCGNILNRFYKEAAFTQAFALVCRKTCNDALMAKTNNHVRQRYKFHEAQLYFADKEGLAPHLETCFLIQMSTDKHIRFDDLSHKVKVQGPLADKVRLSIQLPNYDTADDFHTNVKANYAKTAMNVINSKLLYKDAVPFWTRTIDDFVHKGKVMQRHDGFVDVAQEKLDEAWRRSGLNGINVRGIGKEPFVPIHLPAAATWQEARAKAQLLDDLAFGVVTTRNGFAIRVLPENRIKAEKVLNPEYTTLIGDDLLSLTKENGVTVEIIGVPRQMDNATLVQQLTLDTLDKPWKCKPTGVLKASTWGKKTVLAIAATMPPRTNVRVEIAGELYMVTIRQHQIPMKQRTHWDKIGVAADSDDESKPSITTMLGARPKARPTKPSAWGNVSGTSLFAAKEKRPEPDYSGMSMGQMYEAKEAHEEGERIRWSEEIPIEIEEQASGLRSPRATQAMETDSADAAAQSSSPAAIPPTSNKTPMKDALMAKLMSIKEDSDELRRTTNDRMAQAKDQFDVFQNEVEAKITIIGDTLVQVLAQYGAQLCHPCHYKLLKEIQDPSSSLIVQPVEPPKKRHRHDVRGPCYFGHLRSSAQGRYGEDVWYTVPKHVQWNGAQEHDVLCHKCFNFFIRRDAEQPVSGAETHTEDTVGMCAIEDTNAGYTSEAAACSNINVATSVGNDDPTSKHCKVLHLNDESDLSGTIDLEPNFPSNGAPSVHGTVDQPNEVLHLSDKSNLSGTVVDTVVGKTANNESLQLSSNLQPSETASIDGMPSGIHMLRLGADREPDRAGIISPHDLPSNPSTLTDDQQYDAFFQEVSDQTHFEQFFHAERSEPPIVNRTVHGKTTYRSLDEHPLFMDNTSQESFDVKRRRLQVSLSRNTLHNSVIDCEAVPPPGDMCNSQTNGNMADLAVLPSRTDNVTCQFAPHDSNSSEIAHRLSLEPPVQCVPIICSTSSGASSDNVAVGQPNVSSSGAPSAHGTTEYLNAPSVACINPLLVQMSDLACNIRRHTNKRRRIHETGIGVDECIIPSASLDDAFTRRAWKQGADPTDSQVQDIGDGAYWAVTLGPRSDVSVLPSYKNRSDKLPNQKRNLHTSASSSDGPPCGRPPDYSG
jgi:hypothetical protein